MSTTDLLVWIERGNATRELAKSKGRDNDESWLEALRSGYFTVEKDRTLLLTEKGQQELTLRRMGS